MVLAQRLFVEEYLSLYFERIQVHGISYYGMFGNDDCQSVLPSWQALIEEHDNIYDLTDDWLPLNDSLVMGGCNHIPDPPFGLKDWCVLDSDEFICPVQDCIPVQSKQEGFRQIEDIEEFFRNRPTLEGILQGISDKLDSFEKAIVVCHAPPASLGLGNIGSGLDVGSQAVHKWIETTQPLLTLHGHIHESPEVTGIHTAQLGQTTVHQPGQQRYRGQLVYSVISIESGSVEIERVVQAVG